jgi:hypothetical protein
MPKIFSTLLLLAALAGCATNDFKVVEALQPGITQPEAQQRIATYGFKRDLALVRPEGGWPSHSEVAFNLPDRAAAVESRRHAQVSAVESYPVSHGLLGFGHLLLFYGPDGRLLEFYRHQIN